MQPRLFFSQFTGGGGADVGAVAAGLTPVGGVEFRPDIAQVYADNFGHPLTVAPVEAVDYATLAERLPGPVYHHHASPSCKRASVANANAGEADDDIAAALGVVRALEALQPVVFTLENVRAYAGFDAYARIVAALRRLGYGMRAQVLNAADYGVPQTRERLILRAVRGADDFRVQLPTPTHQESPPPAAQMGLWDVPALPRWVGWYAAIADLVDTLPASEFAPWQLARLPESIRGGIVMHPTEMRSEANRQAADPFFTVLAGSNAGDRGPWAPRAFIVGGSNTSDVKAAPGVGVSMADEPVRAVPADIGVTRYRAWLVSGENAGQEWGKGARADGEPAYAVSSANKGATRAWLAAGRVVKMTPRALARFQSFPDDYRLPERAALACEIIGNAVPPLLMQRVAELDAPAQEVRRAA